MVSIQKKNNSKGILRKDVGIQIWFCGWQLKLAFRVDESVECGLIIRLLVLQCRGPFLPLPLTSKRQYRLASVSPRVFLHNHGFTLANYSLFRHSMGRFCTCWISCIHLYYILIVRFMVLLSIHSLISLSLIDVKTVSYWICISIGRTLSLAFNDLVGVVVIASLTSGHLIMKY